VIQSYLHTLRRFNRDVRLCLVATALIGFTLSGGIYSVLLNLYLLRLGYGPEFIGLVNAMSPLAVVLSSFPAGAIGERWGSRNSIIAGLVLAGLGSGGLALGDFSPGPFRDGWILSTYLVVGAGMALYMVNVTPFLMDATSPQERNHVFSARVTFLPLAGFVGSLVGGLLPGLLAAALDTSLDRPVPYRYPLLIAAVLLLPAVFVMSLASGWSGTASRDSRMPDRPSVGSPVALIAFLAFIGFLRVMGEGAPRAFINVYLDADLNVPIAQIGLLLGVARLLAVPAGLVMPLIAARWGHERTIAFGALGVALSLLPLALIPHWLAAGLGFMAMTALAAIARSAFIVFVMEVVAPRWRAAMSGATTMSASISWAATAYGGGYLVAMLGYRGVFLVGAALTVTGAALFWGRFCRGRCVQTNRST
jgi:MFS family permease